jgi:hypothetical protein
MHCPAQTRFFVCFGDAIYLSGVKQAMDKEVTVGFLGTVKAVGEVQEFPVFLVVYGRVLIKHGGVFQVVPLLRLMSSFLISNSGIIKYLFSGLLRPATGGGSKGQGRLFVSAFGFIDLGGFIEEFKGVVAFFLRKV